jgi:hypothetical protein
MVMAYELRLAALETWPEGSASLAVPAGPAVPAGLAGLAGAPGPAVRPQPASLAELNGLKEHLMAALVAIGTLPADNPEHFFRPFKTTLERAGITSREVRAWRGLARQALWLRGRVKD